jgi:hypothetical protein
MLPSPREGVKTTSAESTSASGGRRRSRAASVTRSQQPAEHRVGDVVRSHAHPVDSQQHLPVAHPGNGLLKQSRPGQIIPHDSEDQQDATRAI